MKTKIALIVAVVVTILNSVTAIANDWRVDNIQIQIKESSSRFVDLERQYDELQLSTEKGDWAYGCIANTECVYRAVISYHQQLLDQAAVAETE